MVTLLVTGLVQRRLQYYYGKCCVPVQPHNSGVSCVIVIALHYQETITHYLTT